MDAVEFITEKKVAVERLPREWGRKLQKLWHTKDTPT
jgi:hypothetical protein